MGALGIAERQSDYGMDQLETIVATQLKAVDFATFNVADALEVIKDFNRPQYKKLVKKLKPDDLLYIKSIDRLGRNYEEIQNQWRALTKERASTLWCWTCRFWIPAGART